MTRRTLSGHPVRRSVQVGGMVEELPPLIGIRGQGGQNIAVSGVGGLRALKSGMHRGK